MQCDTVTLGTHSFEEICETIALPEGEDVNEWIATTLSDLFNQVTMLYGTLSEYCTERSCPIMAAGTIREYAWADNSTEQPLFCAAPKYIDILFTWMQNLLDDESLFPSKVESTFSPTFLETARLMFKRLFRVFAHIYHSHADNLISLGQLRHANTSLRHFVLFVREFSLVGEEEMSVLQPFINRLCGPPKQGATVPQSETKEQTPVQGSQMLS